MLEPGHGVNDSGRVRSRVSATDPVSDPVFVVFARVLLLLLGKEIEDLPPWSLWDFAYSVFSRRDLYACCMDLRLLAESIHHSSTPSPT